MGAYIALVVNAELGLIRTYVVNGILGLAIKSYERSWTLPIEVA